MGATRGHKAPHEAPSEGRENISQRCVSSDPFVPLRRTEINTSQAHTFDGYGIGCENWALEAFGLRQGLFVKSNPSEAGNPVIIELRPWSLIRHDAITTELDRLGEQLNLPIQ